MSDTRDVTCQKVKCRLPVLHTPLAFLVHVIFIRTSTIHSEQRKGLDQLFIFTSRILMLGPGQRGFQGR